MQKVNLVYENDYNDVDILLVPDHIAGELQSVVQQFFNWLKDSHHRCQFEIDFQGRKILSIGTREFVWWLENYAIREAEHVEILNEHTTFCEEYPIAEF